MKNSESQPAICQYDGQVSKRQGSRKTLGGHAPDAQELALQERRSSVHEAWAWKEMQGAL